MYLEGIGGDLFGGTNPVFAYTGWDEGRKSSITIVGNLAEIEPHTSSDRFRCETLLGEGLTW